MIYIPFFHRFYNLLQIPMSISATEIGINIIVLKTENSKSETFCRSHVCGSHRIHLTASAIICYLEKICPSEFINNFNLFHIFPVHWFPSESEYSLDLKSGHWQVR